MDLAFATGMLLNDVIAAQMPGDGLLKHDVNKTQIVKDAIEFEIAESPDFGEMPATLRTTAQKSPSLMGQANESAPCLCATCVTSRPTQHDIDKASKLPDSILCESSTQALANKDHMIEGAQVKLPPPHERNFPIKKPSNKYFKFKYDFNIRRQTEYFSRKTLNTANSIIQMTPIRIAHLTACALVLTCIFPYIFFICVDTVKGLICK